MVGWYGIDGGSCGGYEDAGYWYVDEVVVDSVEHGSFRPGSPLGKAVPFEPFKHVGHAAVVAQICYAQV